MFEVQEPDDLEREDQKQAPDLFKNFQSYDDDILGGMKNALRDEADDFGSAHLPSFSEEDLEAEVITNSRPKSQIKDLDEYNSIFDKMEEEDASLAPVIGSAPKDITQSLEDIHNDFPGIVVKSNNLFADDSASPKELPENKFESN